jgi:hypothetical protein
MKNFRGVKKCREISFDKSIFPSSSTPPRQEQDLIKMIREIFFIDFDSVLRMNEGLNWR